MPQPTEPYSAGLAAGVRETETMDPQFDMQGIPSGELPDDEDISDPVADFTVSDGSGSGYEGIWGKGKHVLFGSIDNSIPDDTKKGVKDVDENTMIANEIIPNKAAAPEGEDLSNKVSMASTANGSIFERTEVLAALIAGGAVGLLFAIFLILLLVYRMKKKDEGSYDLGKKPIYKKAPTNEFYA
uniref:Syndecan n=1 Tax=Sphenodon punctatus TaxID=8508 RepID=A0A8D0GHA7_SPHPU